MSMRLSKRVSPSAHLHSNAEVAQYYGLGRVFEKLTSKLASDLTKIVGRLSYELGYGPHALAKQIIETFGEKDSKLALLDALHDYLNKTSPNETKKISELRKACLSLMEYALPDQKLTTQQSALQCIAELSTGYPGLRSFFLCSKGFKEMRVPRKADIIECLWQRAETTSDPKWSFYHRFASYCMSDEEFIIMVEKIAPSKLGHSKDGPCIIEKLLLLIDENSITTMRCAVAIRYLCGILELPTFWQETYYEDHCPIADKLIKRTVKVLEDIGVSPHSIDVKYPIPEDTEGIDRLVCATLTGVQTWQRQMDNEKLQSGCWFSDFQKLLTVILWSGLKGLTPKSHRIACGLQELCSLTYKTEPGDVPASTPGSDLTQQDMESAIISHEYKRLDKQHIMFKLAFWNSYPAPELVKAALEDAPNCDRKILDVGSGSGQWAIAMAAEFPNAQVLGLDIAPAEVEDLPKNCRFQIHDVNTGLEPWHNTIDVVHVRCLGGGVTSYKTLIDEVAKCLRPGGVAVFIDGDFDLVKEDLKSLQEPFGEKYPNGSCLQYWLHLTRHAQVTRCSFKDVDNAPELLDKGLWDFEVYDKTVSGCGAVYTPTAPWPIGDTSEETFHFKLVGTIARQNLRAFLKSTYQILVADGNDPDMLNELRERVEKELDGGTFKTWLRWRVAWARKPLENGQSAPMARVPEARSLRASIGGKSIDFHAPNARCKYTQFHVLSQKQAEKYVQARNQNPLSTRLLY